MVLGRLEEFAERERERGIRNSEVGVGVWTWMD